MKVRLSFNRIGTWYEELPLGLEFEGWVSEERLGIVFVSIEFFILYTDCEVVIEEETKNRKRELTN